MGWVFFLGGGSWEAAPSPRKAAGAAPGANRFSAAPVFWRPGAQPRSPRRQAHPAPLCGTPALSSPLVGVEGARLPVRGGAGFHRLLSFPPLELLKPPLWQVQGLWRGGEYLAWEKKKPKEPQIWCPNFRAPRAKKSRQVCGGGSPRGGGAAPALFSSRQSRERGEGHT